MGIIQTAPPKERDPGIYPAGRICPSCEAILSRNNPASTCQPCLLKAMPEVERMSEAA